MIQRNLLKKLPAVCLAGAGAMAPFTLSQPSALAAPGDKPNILMIVSDDHGYNDVASYGATDALTPFIDSIGQAGIRFTDFYVSPVCTPTRFCLMTGLHINRSQDDLWDVVLSDHAGRGLRQDKTTLAEVFLDNGYQTALVGKWHLGQGSMAADPPPLEYTPEEFHPQFHGFESFYGHLGGMIDYNTHKNNLVVLDWQRDTTRLPEEDNQYSTHLIAQNAVQYLNDHAADSDPFFLYVPFNAPHRGTGNVDLPPNEETERTYLSRFDFTGLPDTDVRKRHLARIAAMDDGIGDILAALASNNIEEDTIVFFIADNGGKLEIGGQNTPLRGEKNTFWEGGIRVPAMVRWTGTIDAGQVSDQVIQHLDLPVTLISLLGLQAEDYRTDGLDLHKQLLGAPDFDRELFYYIPDETELMRYGNWKYIKLDNGADELYDLVNDRSETTNVAASHPTILADLKARFDAQKIALDNPAPLPLPSFDADSDGDVDKDDFAEFETCMTGPENGPFATGCGSSDGDFDGDVDLRDIAAFQRAFGGPSSNITTPIFLADFEDGEVNPGKVNGSTNTTAYPTGQPTPFNQADVYGWQNKARTYTTGDTTLVDTVAHTGENSAEVINRFLRVDIDHAVQADSVYTFTFWYMVPTGMNLTFSNRVVVKDETNGYYFIDEMEPNYVTAPAHDIWFSRTITFNTRDYEHAGEAIDFRFGAIFNGDEGDGACTDTWSMSYETSAATP